MVLALSETRSFGWAGNLRPVQSLQGGDYGFGCKRTPINLAEIIIIHTKILRYTALPSFVLVTAFGFLANPVLSLVVWTLKREVRAIRGCLGVYRR
jgi:hypothetical protein